MIDIHFLGHATIAIDVEEELLLFDPHLNDSYRHNLFGYYPYREVNIKLLESVTSVFISHSHRDHFDVKSLELLPRSATVFIPNDGRIQLAVSSLGFMDVFIVDDWTELKFTDSLKIILTPSTFRVPEHGYLIQCGGVNIWNMVDSHVTKNWCEKVKELCNGDLDFILLPSQPLIEANTSHALAPLVDKHKIEEIIMIIDTLQPTFTIPFADGHYCINESKWVNKHWIPFSEIQKYEVIDYANYKSQILSCHAGNLLSIKGLENFTSFQIGDSRFLNKVTKQVDRNYGPSVYFPAVKSFSKGSVIGDLPLEKELNLYDIYPHLKNRIFFHNAIYKLLIIDENSNVVKIFEFYLNNGVICVNDSVDSDKSIYNAVEICIGSEQWNLLLKSEVSYSAILIGGMIREYHKLSLSINEVNLFRDFSDLFNGKKEYLLSGIFLVNMILTNGAKRYFDEIELEIAGSHFSFNNSYTQEYRHLIDSDVKFDEWYINILEKHLNETGKLTGVSGQYIIDSERVFIGYLGDSSDWYKLVDVQCEKYILILVNIGGKQSILGQGIQFPKKDVDHFIRQISRASVSEWIVESLDSLLMKVPEWRRHNIFPVSEQYIIDVLKTQFSYDKSILGRISKNPVSIKWWLGIPEIKVKGTKIKCCYFDINGIKLIGTVNERKCNGITFKDNRSFIIHEAIEYYQNNYLVSNLLMGNVRVDWLLDMYKSQEVYDISDEYEVELLLLSISIRYLQEKRN